jgi:hypothetical protein
MRLTIDEYAARYRMSKEMVYAKLRAKRLDYTVENGVTYILLPDTVQSHSQTRTPARSKTTVGTIIALYQKENQHLKNRIADLEAKIDKLIDDKEQMLREERDRIETLYSNKDEQLRSILELINTKLMLSQTPNVHDVSVDNPGDSIEASLHDSDFVELRDYLKRLELTSQERKTIKKRFAAAYGSDIRVIQQNGAFYLDFSKYDYSDLLKH